MRRHFDLLMWLQGDVQRYLPHEILVSAWGDFGSDRIHHDVVSPLPGVRTEPSELANLAPLLRGMFSRWCELGKEPYVLSVGECGFPLEDADLRCALGGALQQMRSALIHGVADERGGHECLYVVFSSLDLHGDRPRSAIRVLLPYLDAALRQIFHPPRAALQPPPWPQPPLPQPLQTLLPPLPAVDHGLTDREVEILGWLKMGKTNQEIGRILDISTFTVKNHVQRIYKKLDVFNRMQAVAKFDKITR